MSIAEAVNKVSSAYHILLTLDFSNDFRIHHQRIYSELRDYIAEKTFRTAEEVQNEFETRVMFPEFPACNKCGAKRQECFSWDGKCLVCEEQEGDI